MTTLVIHHPEEEVAANQKKSFSICCSTGIGQGFAISKAKVAILKPGDKVVILCNTKGFERRAEGVLDKLIHSGATDSGLKRYDVYIKNISQVGYHRSDFGKLTHNGIAVF
ncbi:hypothetical protein [Aeromonas veronii]|uniref:hypothetical protein n=1 Tax=Aeromonas veronii TaxID=654 RepID=UPI003BA2C0D4